jgi:GH25 family lysozyme M1 (1,4-beta-N-acetylmuramidase)
VTIFYPDISNFQAAVSLKGQPAVCILVSQDTGFVNPSLTAQKAEAAREGAWAFGYHFLQAGNAAAQAQHYHASADGLPCMIDTERYTNSNPSIADVLAFATELRALGGTVHLCYLPEWYWSSIGSPSLTALHQAGLSLVASAYPDAGYSDTGTGWEPYGGASPVIWQYTDKHVTNGTSTDYNAFRGTVDQLKALVTGAVAAPLKPAPKTTTEDPEMNIAATESTKTISWEAGTVSGLAITCGAPGEQTLTVSLYAAADKVSYLTKAISVTQGRALLDFPAAEKDTTYMAYITRQGAAASWKQLWTHTF